MINPDKYKREDKPLWFEKTIRSRFPCYPAPWYEKVWVWVFQRELLKRTLYKELHRLAVSYNFRDRQYSQLLDRVNAEACEAGSNCPVCKGKLVPTIPDLLLLSDPPQKEMYCIQCNYKGFRQV